MQFEPDNQLGKQLQSWLIQQIQQTYGKGAEDSQDIADYIIYLIVGKKNSQEIINEVQDVADISINLEFLETIYGEIRKLEAGAAAPEQQQQQQQQSQQQQQQVSMDISQIPTAPKRVLTEQEKLELRQQRFGVVGRGGVGKFRNGQNANNNSHHGNFKRFPDAKRLEKALTDAAKHGGLKFVDNPPRGRCPDFPYCKNKACERSHPTKNCFQYPNCPNPPGTCNFLHPDQDQELIAKLETAKKEFEQKRTNQIMVKQGSCKYGLKCAKQSCPFAHPTPANPEAKIETLDWCAQGKNCQDPACVKSHPPPPSATGENVLSGADLALEQCKFGAQCTNVKCPRRHATSAVPCREGAACRRIDCTFNHPIKEPCRFGIKCMNKNCMYQHPEGRVIASNTWVNGAAVPSGNPMDRTFAVSEDQVMEQVGQ
ncbi:NAB2 Nuclear polyadenylated RNA-binding protein NAB2 [Candida maltosa Xu316]